VHKIALPVKIGGRWFPLVNTQLPTLSVNHNGGRTHYAHRWILVEKRDLDRRSVRQRNVIAVDAGTILTSAEGHPTVQMSRISNVLLRVRRDYSGVNCGVAFDSLSRSGR